MSIKKNSFMRMYVCMYVYIEIERGKILLHKRFCINSVLTSKMEGISVEPKKNCVNPNIAKNQRNNNNCAKGQGAICVNNDAKRRNKGIDVSKLPKIDWPDSKNVVQNVESVFAKFCAISSELGGSELRRAEEYISDIKSAISRTNEISQSKDTSLLANSIKHVTYTTEQALNYLMHLETSLQKKCVGVVSRAMPDEFEKFIKTFDGFSVSI